MFGSLDIRYFYIMLGLFYLGVIIRVIMITKKEQSKQKTVISSILMSAGLLFFIVACLVDFKESFFSALIYLIFIIPGSVVALYYENKNKKTTKSEKSKYYKLFTKVLFYSTIVLSIIFIIVDKLEFVDGVITLEIARAATYSIFIGLITVIISFIVNLFKKKN